MRPLGLIAVGAAVVSAAWWCMAGYYTGHLTWGHALSIDWMDAIVTVSVVWHDEGRDTGKLLHVPARVEPVSVRIEREVEPSWQVWSWWWHAGPGFVDAQFPIWLVPAAFGAGAAALWWRIRSRRRPPGHCATCGYDLTGNMTGRCPECGASVQPRKPGAAVSAVTGVE